MESPPWVQCCATMLVRSWWRCSWGSARDCACCEGYRHQRDAAEPARIRWGLRPPASLHCWPGQELPAWIPWVYWLRWRMGLVATSVGTHVESDTAATSLSHGREFRHHLLSQI